MEDGRKDDNGKLQWSLLPVDAVEEILKVLMFGAQKYEAHNWAKGMDWDRPYNALMRHMWAWWRGEDRDPESGLSHLAHAGCCILFLIAYQNRRTGNDTRYNLPKAATYATETEARRTDSPVT